MTTKTTTSSNSERLPPGLQIAIAVGACCLAIAMGAAFWYGATAHYLEKENANLLARLDRIAVSLQVTDTDRVDAEVAILKLGWDGSSRIFSWDQLPADHALEVRNVTGYSIEGMGGQLALLADSTTFADGPFYLVSVPTDMQLRDNDHCWPAQRVCQPAQQY